MGKYAFLPAVSLKSTSIAFLLPLQARLYLIQSPTIHQHFVMLPVSCIDTSMDDVLNMFDEMGTWYTCFFLFFPLSILVADMYSPHIYNLCLAYSGSKGSTEIDMVFSTCSRLLVREILCFQIQMHVLVLYH